MQSKVRQAACVVLLRPDENGAPQVYLARRSEKLAFLGGFWAFPGGGVDAGDHQVPVHRAPSEAQFCGAALRELFEETGVLAVPDAGRVAGADRMAWRRALESNPSAWGTGLAERGLTLDGSALIPMGVWWTPPFYHVTFHAQYFGLILPAGEMPEVSGGELTEGAWLTPDEALLRHRRGEIFISYPVLETLRGLVGADMAALRERAADLQARGAHPHIGGEMVHGVHCVPVRTFTLPPATHTNCYVLGGQRVVVVDPGSPLPEEQALLDGYLDRLRAQGAQIDGVWLTHFHHDHIGGAEHLRERYKVPVQAHRETARLVEDALRIDGFIDDGTTVPFEHDGQEARWQALFTPGHAQGHLCFYEQKQGHLLSGDTVLGAGSTLVAPRPDGSMGDYMASLRRLLQLRLGVIFPGHGPPVAAAEDKIQEYLRHRQGREDAIIAACAEPRSVQEIVAHVYTDVDVRMHALAETNVRAHLEKLADEGRVIEKSGRYVQTGDAP